MNGDSAELCVKINRMPINTKTIIIGISHQSFLFHRKTKSSLNTKTIIIGISHQSFLFHRKTKSSLNMPTLDTTLFPIPIFVPF